MKKVPTAKFLGRGAALFLYFSFSLQFVLVTSVAFAAEEGGHEPSLFMAYFWAIINFLILVFLLVFMAKKMDLKGVFRKRTELIEQSIKEAQEAKELARKALAEVEERLKMKDAEIAEIVNAAAGSAEKEKSRLVEEGDRLKERILDQARVNIDYEVRRAMAAIKEEAAEIAMELAEKKLKEKITKEEQMKLLEESVAKIEGKK